MAELTGASAGLEPRRCLVFDGLLLEHVCDLRIVQNVDGGGPDLSTCKMGDHASSLVRYGDARSTTRHRVICCSLRRRTRGRNLHGRC